MSRGLDTAENSNEISIAAGIRIEATGDLDWPVTGTIRGLNFLKLPILDAERSTITGTAF